MTPRAPAMTADERRASIIEATLPLLRERGRAVSTKDISKAAGIAEGTIFRVFASKDELIHACIHDAFDTRGVRLEIRGVRLDQPLHERLTAAVEIMQTHLRGLFTLMMTLHATGQAVEPQAARGPKGRPRFDRQRSVEELDADFEALLAPDLGRLRLPPEKVVDYLRMLTLASVHPFLDGRGASAGELVDVVLEGALQHHADAEPVLTTSSTNPTSRGRSQCSSV